jgi:taurine dioxygenase
MTALATRLEIVPSGDALGADVLGIDLDRPLSTADRKALESAWSEHLVLRFRGQHDVPVERLADFSRNFGALDGAPVASTSMGSDFQWQHPEITVISNVKVEGKPIGGLGDGESVWHADMTYNAKPPKGSCLYAVEVPPAGGNTQFANMYVAYETLPPDLKRTASQLTCVHDASRNSAGELRRGYADIDDPRHTVGARHPIVRVHPATGRPCLFLGRRRNAYLVGLPLDESEALLDALWAHATQPELVWTQVWKVGDMIMWDNRCTLHRRDSFDPATRRLLLRTQITGEPVQGLQ